MIDFYTEGAKVGITFHGIDSFLLITYFVLEMIILFTTGSLFIHKLVIWINLRREIKKIIPKWWKVDSVRILSINRTSTGFEVFVKATNKINKNWSNDYVIVNQWGKIKSEKLTTRIKLEDREQELEIKEWQRNKVLENIGI